MDSNLNVSDVVESFGDIRAKIADHMRSFVDAYVAKKLPPLAITATGGGISMADLAKFPGASQVLHSVNIPYAKSASLNMALLGGEIEDYKAVSALTADQLYSSSIVLNGSETELNHVVCTAALATNRYRRGDDQAFIRTFGGVFHFRFPRESEESYARLIEGRLLEKWRLLQDFALSMTALNIVAEGDPLGAHEIFPGSELTWISETELKELSLA